MVKKKKTNKLVILDWNDVLAGASFILRVYLEDAWSMLARGRFPRARVATSFWSVITVFFGIRSL